MAHYGYLFSSYHHHFHQQPPLFLLARVTNFEVPTRSTQRPYTFSRVPFPGQGWNMWPGPGPIKAQYPSGHRDWFSYMPVSQLANSFLLPSAWRGEDYFLPFEYRLVLWLTLANTMQWKWWCTLSLYLRILLPCSKAWASLLEGGKGCGGQPNIQATCQKPIHD